MEAQFHGSCRRMGTRIEVSVFEQKVYAETQAEVDSFMERCTSLLHMGQEPIVWPEPIRMPVALDTIASSFRKMMLGDRW